MDEQIKRRYVRALAYVPGITEEIAVELVNAGITSKAQIFAASDEELAKIKGLTKARRDEVKKFKADSIAKSRKKLPRKR